MDIEKFIEDNRSWLDKFDNTNYNKNGEVVSWWFGSAMGESYLNLSCSACSGYYLEDSSTVYSSCGWSCLLDHYYTGNETNVLEQYFNIWTHPTKQELDYYEMIHSYRLPWSEEHPFIIDEIFNQEK